MTKRQLELLIESISFHQLHLQKLYLEENDKNKKDKLLCEHEELCRISKMLIKELDNYDKEN